MLEPDASIDTRLTNGLLVRESQVEPGGFIVRDGRIALDDDAIAEAWRTVDASGYCVLPAMIQPGLPHGDQARALAAGGVGTTIVTLLAETVPELASCIAKLAERAVMDYVLVWRVPDNASRADLQAARDFGVAAFAHSESDPDFDATLTSRLPLPASLDTLKLNDLPARVILTTADPEQARDAACHAVPGAFVELSTSELREDPRDWSAVANLDGPVCVTGDRLLLLKLFEFGVRAHGMPMSLIARLTSINVAAAYGIDTRKRGIAVGADADVVVFDAAAQDADLPGRAVFSLQRGEILLYNDEVHTTPGSGLRLPE